MAITPKSRRVSFLRRFRVVVQKWLYFQREVSELGPRYYYCTKGGSDRCNGPRKDPYNGCPKCEYTLKYEYFENDCEKEFKRGLRDPQDTYRWPLAIILESVGTVMRANGQTRKGYSPRWTVAVTRLIDIYRDEVNRQKVVDAWNHKQEMEAMMAEYRRGSGSRDHDGE